MLSLALFFFTLQVVWLQQNQLSGSVPPQLADLPSIRVLWLQDNAGLMGEELRARLTAQNSTVNCTL